MLIRDILKKKGSKTITTSKETKILDVAHILTKEKIGAIVIVEKEEVIGILRSGTEENPARESRRRKKQG